MSKKNIPVVKNHCYTISVTGVTLEGLGVGRVDNFAVFIKNAIPCETVLAKIIKVSGSFAVARIESVLVSSPWRKEPDCPFYRQCGGCSFQHITYAGQLEIKKKAVDDCIQRIGGFHDIEIEPVIASPEYFRYRNKGAFPCGKTENGEVGFGFYAPRSHSLVKVNDCLLESRKIIEGVLGVEKWIRDANIEPYDEKMESGFLRHAVFRETCEGKLMCTLVTTGTLRDPKSLIACLSMADSIYVNINSNNTNVIFGNEYQHIYGDKKLTEYICGHRYFVSPPTFLQVNHNQAEALYEKAIKLLAPRSDETIYDLYCGMGSISLCLAEHAGKVIGIEVVPEAIADAKENAVVNGIENTSFLCGNTEDIIDELCDKEPPSAIMLDPPRKGCEENVLAAIKKSGCSRIVYVSCNPATLARDLQILCKEEEYSIVTIQPVDMFPQTSHVETVVLLSRKNINATSYLDLTISTDKKSTGGQATYEEIKEYVKEQFGLSVSHLYIAQVKDKCGFEKRDNYNIGQGKAPVPQCPPEKEKAIMEAFKHFGMI